MEKIGTIIKDKIGDEINRQIGLTGQDQPVEYLKAGSEMTKDITEKNEKLKGGESDNFSLLDLAKKHSYDDSTDSVSKSKINKMFLHLKKQLNKGVKNEMEHTKSKKIATEIAKDHLYDDPNYYTNLEKMETKEQVIKRAISKPIGNLVTMGKVESKEATGASGAGQFSGPLFSMFSKDKAKVDKETPKLKKEETKEGCWKGFKQVGMKDKNGKQVPNCVKNKKSVNENEIISESENTPTNPQLWSRAKSMAKSKFKVYPSAYANGWAAKWYKEHGGGWRKKKKKESKESNETLKEDLRRWFKEKWVDVSKKVDGKHPPCGRKDAEGKSYPKCRPSKKVSKETPKVASSYSKDEKKSMTQQKRRAEKKEPKLGKGNTPTFTHYDSSKKTETKEATGASSSGQYSTPQIWAKSMGKKNWKPSRKTQIPGGSFVTVKEKCKKFPYCNQGDIKALNIFENETLKNVIKNIEEKHGISENIIKAVIQYEIEKLNMKK